MSGFHRARTLVSSLSVSRKKSCYSVSHFISWYKSKLDRHPLLTKSLTASLIAGTGDVSCQCMTSLHEWNWKRTGRFMLVGGLYSAPARHVLFHHLARAWPGSSLGRVTQRVFLERLVFAPASLAVWLTTMWTLESWTGEETAVKLPYGDRFVETYPALLWTSWTWWTPIMFLQFRYVPVPYQVLFVNAFNLVWNTYLSYMTSTSREENHNIGVAPPGRTSSIGDRLEHAVELHMVTHRVEPFMNE